MSYKNSEEAISAEKLMQAEIKGIWEHKGYLITKMGEHNLCKITTADPEESLPRPLQGKWTDVVTAKAYIDSFLEAHDNKKEGHTA